MTLTVEVATVYRAAGRRWFTKRAAFRAEARALVKEHCDCDPPEPPLYSGLACMYHRDPELYGDLIDVLAGSIQAGHEVTPALLELTFDALHVAHLESSRAAFPVDAETTND